MSDIVMPRLSDSMIEGTVVRWLKQPGDTVTRGEPIVEIETDKATITYEADLDGILAEILVGEGATVPVGAQIARIAVAGEAIGAAAPAPEAAAAAAPQQTQTPAPPPPPAPPAAPSPLATPAADSGTDSPPPVFEVEPSGDDGGRVKASPIARRLARKLGIDLAAISGSGPGGRIVKEDVEAASSAAASAQSAPQAPTQAPAEPPPPESWQPPEPPPEPLAQSSEPQVSRQPEPQSQPQPRTHAEPEPHAEPEFAQQPEFAQSAAPAFESPESASTTVYKPVPLPMPVDQPLSEPPVESASSLTPPGAPGLMQPGLMPPGVAPTAPPAPAATLPPIAPPLVQPLPGPAPFVSGMTGGFPAIQPQAGMPLPGALQPPLQSGIPATGLPQAGMPQAGMPQAGMPATATATRGQVIATELSGAQQTVARRMAESKATAPDFFVEIDVDMTNAVNYREQLKLAVQPAPSFNDMVIKACALALRQYPKVNGAYKDGHFEHYGDANVGFVVAAGELLAMPTLFNADQKGLAQIARESTELANAVRTRTIQPAQLSGGTFSVSNLGMYGVDRFTAILNPPQAAILAVGAIKRKPVIAEDGVSLAIRQIMALTLTCDHRILYGAEGAEFLAAVKAWLESPQSLPV